MYPNAPCVSDQKFICSPWRPVVGRTDRQEKDKNSEDLAGDHKLDSRPLKPGGLIYEEAEEITSWDFWT